jgi:hypothetical protein
MVRERAERRLQPRLIPACVASWSEEDGSLVVINAVNSPTEGIEMGADLAANESRGASHKYQATNHAQVN